MSDMIRIRPARNRRVAFARWATAQNPKIRTVSEDAFAVPAWLFVQAPEDILIGALVDGHRYVSPVEDAAARRPAPAAPLPIRKRPSPVPQALPTAAPATYTPVPGPGSAPAATAVGDDEAGLLACGQCPRKFTSERGRDTHLRRAHPEG